MTAVTVASAARAADPRGGLPWTILRLHRSALWTWGLLVALSASALLWSIGPGVDAAFAELQVICGRPIDYCESGPATVRYELVVFLGSWLFLLTPGLVAAWAGAALVGREMENGTAALLWTQSVTPTRWLAAKLTVPAVLLASGAALLTLLHRVLWESEADVRAMTWSHELYAPVTYLTSGPVAVAYPLLGLAVGVLAGLVLRRALPALAVALGTMGATVLAFDWLRPHLWPVETVAAKDDFPDWSGTTVEMGAVTADGRHVADSACWDGACRGQDVVAFYVDFHPDSHFLPLQLVETGVVLALAALAVTVSFQLLRRGTGAAA